MKKILLLAIIMITAISSAFAGPFGLEMGMSLDEVTKVCGGARPERLENDDRYLISPTKSHPDFKYYLVFVDDNKGLYAIRAISTEIKTTQYGTELKSFFYEMTERLSKTYGKSNVKDEIKSDALFKADEWWMMSLGDGSRILGSLWSGGTGTVPKDLDYVYLYASARKYSINEGYLILEYMFNNREDIKKSQDDVF